jgi:purine-binding chemotaxis protein CheW
MSTKMAELSAVSSSELQFATFFIGDLLMGINIQQVQEINRHLEMTAVPHAPGHVRGVVNLRGEVVTVLDLSIILGLGSTNITSHSRNVIVDLNDEKTGLLVDRIADVVIAQSSEIESPPANVSGIDGHFFKGVCKLESNLLIIIDIESVINLEDSER